MEMFLVSALCTVAIVCLVVYFESAPEKVMALAE